MSLEGITSYTGQVLSITGKGLLKSLSVIDKISTFYNLWDSAIANILCMESPTHGTSLYSYCSIHLQGAKTSWAGKGGESRYLQQHTKSIYRNISENVFVMGDSTKVENPDISRAAFYRVFYRPIVSLHYSFKANHSSLGISSKSNAFTKTVGNLATVLLASITPHVKFHYTPEQMENEFSVDDSQLGALFTDNDMPITHMGILGSLIHGVNTGVFGRIRSRPFTFMLGVAQLVAAVALTTLFVAQATTVLPILSQIQCIETISQLAKDALSSSSLISSSVSCLGIWNFSEWDIGNKMFTIWQAIRFSAMW